MNRAPLDLALQHIVETHRLLETVITSSESFDYRNAKLALKALQKKSRELARVRAELEAQRELPPNVISLSAATAQTPRRVAE